jgi:hypothetical protein
MPYVIQPGNIIQARVWCTAGDQASVNTLYYLPAPGMVVGPTDQMCAVAIDNQIATVVKATLSDDAFYNGVQVSVPLVRPLNATVFSTNGAGPGAVANASGPRQAACVISLNTAFAGPAYRGRLFWPFPPNSLDTDIGIPSGPYVALLQAAMAQIVGPIGVVGGGGNAILNYVLFHRNATVVPRTTPITSFAVRTKWGTQKRRGSYGRQNASPI